MSNRIWVELCRSNGVVTDAYLHAIGDSFARAGFRVEYIYSAEKCPGSKSDIYVVAVAPSVAKLLTRGRRNVVFWAQGVWPEESFERQCSNEPFHREAFFTEGKYDHPVFLYAGSLAKYQRIDLMLDAFAQAQQALPEARLLFYTRELDEAKRLVEERGLHNVEISYKTQVELPAAIAVAKYGFVIRDDSIVNRISTPTKISTYIANGIIPLIINFIRTLPTFIRTCADECGKCSDEVDNQGNNTVSNVCRDFRWSRNAVHDRIISDNETVFGDCNCSGQLHLRLVAYLDVV